MVAGTSQERLRVVIVVRCDVGRMVVAAAAAQQQQASSLRQLISMSLTVNPMNWATLVAATAASTVTVARPVRSRGIIYALSSHFILSIVVIILLSASATHPSSSSSVFFNCIYCCASSLRHNMLCCHCFNLCDCRIVLFVCRILICGLDVMYVCH